MLPSDPTAPIVQATKYYDEINDSFILGARLECQVDKSSDCLAHTFPRIYSDNERIRLPEFPRQPGQFSQPNDRVSITVSLDLYYCTVIKTNTETSCSSATACS